MDMPVDSSEIEVRARPPRGVFRTMENALEPGWHIWETNYAPAGQDQDQDWRATGLSCETTIWRAGAGGGPPPPRGDRCAMTPLALM